MEKAGDAKKRFLDENVCKNNGISIEAIDRDLLENGENGCDGLYNFKDKRIQYASELCHPKYADAVITEDEQSIRRLKAKAKEKNEYYPYSKCDLTIYSPKSDGGLNALHTCIDIGDKSQIG